MVACRLRWIAVLAGTIVCACQAKTKPAAKPETAAGSVCMGRYVGFGQNTSTVLCRQDSCFAVRHARNQEASAPVGFYAGALGPKLYPKARGIAAAAVAKKDWKMMMGAPALRIVLDDTLERTISMHPANSERMDPLDDWKEAVMDSLLSRPVWTDSLALAAEGGKGSLLLSLSSGKPGEAWLGKNPDIRFQFGVKEAAADSQVTADSGCVRQLLSGGRCRMAAPKNAHWAKAVVRGEALDATLGAGKACLEGRFELVSEWTATGR